MKVIPIDDIKAHKVLEPKVSIRPALEYFSDWVDHTNRSRESVGGWPTLCWPGFNHHFGGARPELVILTGQTGRGKTTFALNWLLDTVEQGRPAMLLSLENGPNDSINALSEMVLGKSSYRDGINDEDRTKFGQALERWPLYIVGAKGMLPEAEVAKALDLGCIKYGVKFVLIDHLDFIQKSVGSRNEAYVIGDTVRWLSGRTDPKQLDTTIVLVVQPNRAGGVYASGKDVTSSKELPTETLKGSSELEHTAASILIHHRPKTQEDKTWIRLAKIRSRDFAQNTKGRIRFGFNPKTQRYIEIDGNLDWGKDD